LALPDLDCDPKCDALGDRKPVKNVMHINMSHGKILKNKFMDVCIDVNPGEFGDRDPQIFGWVVVGSP